MEDKISEYVDGLWRRFMSSATPLHKGAIKKELAELFEKEFDRLHHETEKARTLYFQKQKELEYEKSISQRIGENLGKSQKEITELKGELKETDKWLRTYIALFQQTSTMRDRYIGLCESKDKEIAELKKENQSLKEQIDLLTELEK